MERDIAFHLLHCLMDVAVEHGHRAESLEVAQSLRAVIRPPAPRGVHTPERNVREHHDRRAAREMLDVALDPVELLGSQ